MLNKDLSRERLGMVGMVPVVPVMPTGAQVSAQTGMMHVKLIGESYVRASLPTIAPGVFKTVVEAIKACPQVPSLSGSGSLYFKLDVEPQADGASAILRAQGVVVGRIAVFPEVDIVSVDEPLDVQVEKTQGGGDEPKSGPQGPGVN
jgi:hypothetical protein